MNRLSILLCLVVLAACHKDDKKKPENHSPENVKILTYNIHHGTPIHHADDDVQLNVIADVIKQQNPDLVALQEIDSMTARAPYDEAKQLGTLTGMHSYFAKTISYQGGSYGIAVLSRYPIASHQKIMLPMPDPTGEQRAVAIIKVEIIPGTPFYFASTHLDLKEENRKAQAKRLLQLSEDLDAPLIFAGDLNAAPAAPEIKTIGEGFSSPCVSNCPKTFPSDKPSETIDYIFLNPQAAALCHNLSYTAISTTLASDHLPLLGYFTMNQ